MSIHDASVLTRASDSRRILVGFHLRIRVEFDANRAGTWHFKVPWDAVDQKEDFEGQFRYLEIPKMLNYLIPDVWLTLIGQKSVSRSPYGILVAEQEQGL